MTFGIFHNLTRQLFLYYKIIYLSHRKEYIFKLRFGGGQFYSYLYNVKQILRVGGGRYLVLDLNMNLYLVFVIYICK